MRPEACVSLLACFIGMVIPLTVVAYAFAKPDFPPNQPAEKIVLGMLGILIIVLTPFVLVALTTWTSRTEQRISRRLMIVALLVLAIALVGWFGPSSGEGVFLTAVFCVPFFQVLTWVVGAVVLSGSKEFSGEPKQTLVCLKGSRESHSEESA